MSPKKQRVSKRETMSPNKRKGGRRGGKGGEGTGVHAKKGKHGKQQEISQNEAAAAVGEVKAKADLPLTKVAPNGGGTTIEGGAGYANISRKFHPTVADIMTDPLVALAQDLWAPGKERGPYQEAVVIRIYEEDLGKGSPSQQTKGRIGVLDYSCYLENYLWPYWGGHKCKAHALSIVILTNEKFARGSHDSEPWVGSDEVEEKEDTTEGKDGKFSASLSRTRFSSLLGVLVDLYLKGKPTMGEKGALVWFIVNAFQSLEKLAIRSAVLPLCSLALWGELSGPHRIQLFLQYPLLGKAYSNLKDTTEGRNITSSNLSSFLPRLASEVIAIVEGTMKRDSSTSFFLARCVELFIDLLSQIPTRRFLRTVLLHICFLERLELSSMNSDDKECGGGVLFQTQVKHLGAILRFEVDDQSGKSLSSAAAAAAHHERIHHAQMVAFLELRDTMPAFPLVSTSAAGKEEHLISELEFLDEASIVLFATKLGLVDEGSTGLELAKRAILNHLAERPSPLRQVNSLALYPDEAELWRKGGGGSEGILLSINDRTSYWGQSLALPKLSLQYLTLRDYLLRNFTLYRLESSCAIRDDVEDALKRLGSPAWPVNEESNTIMVDNGRCGGMMPKFGGWARYAVPVKTSEVVAVRPPHIGQVVPAEVLGEVTIDVGKFSGPVREEWNDLKEHDVVFLVKLVKTEEDMSSFVIPVDKTKTFKEEKGIEYVRGAEIVTVEDESSRRGGGRRGGDNNINPMQQQLNKPLVGNHRKIRLRLDPAQYRDDVAASISVYDSFHVLVRRIPQENNFRGVLESVRDVMNDEASAGDEDVTVIPTWLHEVLLGYGDPSLACPKEGEGETLDFADTFLDSKHARDAFSSEYKVEFTGDSNDPSPPYRVTFPGPGKKSKGIVTIVPYPDPPPATAGLESPRRNTIRFTPTQVRAVRRAMRPGLTLIVGPPGTGKTDVATQVISNLYRAYPKERILVVAHSNGALNDLFDKTFERDIDTRHLLRLGAGERDLAAAGDFSKLGRVNHALERRLILLEEVQQLSVSISTTITHFGDPGTSCETAGLFFETHIDPRITRFVEATASVCDDENVRHMYPFATHFACIGLWQTGEDITLRMARRANMHLIRMFEELGDYKAFEVLRTHSARAEYLFTTQARIVALTCTHASLQRRRLLDAEVTYDTVIMEESAQMLEVETLIPLLLQRGGRLKRVCLIGDHRQLPPVVKCLPLKSYSNLEQSMFSRLVRLGVPTVQLDMQGRARPSLAALYRWRYDGLQDLPLVLNPGFFTRANAGFAHVCQAVDVEDFNNAGETAPTPHFFQNLGEAEYVVAIYQYMRLLGYPSNRIAILTTYKGQRALLRDVIGQRCANNPLFGLPHIIETVDSYQGKESDYVLLSLVRTKAVGHIRDARRLVVALSRSRLGLYVFCRRALFENCFELLPAFNHLLKRPSILQLILSEQFPAERDENGRPDTGIYDVQNVLHMGQLVHGMANLAKTAHFSTSREESATAQQKIAPAPSEKGSDPGVEEVSHAAEGEGDEEDPRVPTAGTSN